MSRGYKQEILEIKLDGTAYETMRCLSLESE